jgi:hypothetical protein
MILWYPDQQRVAPLGFYILGNLMIPGKSRRYGKDGMSKYHKMLLLHMPHSFSI